MPARSRRGCAWWLTIFASMSTVFSLYASHPHNRICFRMPSGAAQKRRVILNPNYSSS